MGKDVLTKSGRAAQHRNLSGKKRITEHSKRKKETEHGPSCDDSFCLGDMAGEHGTSKTREKTIKWVS